MGLSDFFKKTSNVSDVVNKAKEEQDGLSFLPGEYENSIYCQIGQNIVDGKLSKEFSLPQDPIAGHFYWAPGAMDGTRFYHMNTIDLEEEDKKELGVILHGLSLNTFRSARDRITALVKKYPMLSWADELQDYIRKNVDNLSLKDLFIFSTFTMYSTNDPETLKFALCLLELFNTNDDENLKNSVRRLALCDEFTLFCLFVILRWSDVEGEMLEIAKKVDGWGRVHAIRMMPAERPETQRWLLFNGCDCSVNEGYTAYNCYEKIGMERMDFAALKTDELKAISKIIYALIDEGPVDGISIIDERYRILGDFVKACDNRPLELDNYETIYAIYLYVKNEDDGSHQEILDNCVRMLRYERCATIVKKAVEEGYGTRLAEALGIDTTDSYMNLLRQNFDEYNGLATSLMKNPEVVDEVIDIFDKNYTPKESAEDEEPYYDNEEMRIVFCIQELRVYPGKGVNLLIKANKSLDPPVRNMVINVAEAWMQNTGKSILEIAPELQEAFIDRLDKELDEKQKLRIKGILCNKIYKQDPIVIETRQEENKYSEEKLDVFVDDAFNEDNWTAPIIDDLAQMDDYVKQCSIRGKYVKSIAFTSELRNYLRSSLEKFAYDAFGGLPERERIENAQYKNIDVGLMVPLEAVTDGAIIIKFDDESQFEVCSGKQGKLRFSMNKIPWNMAVDSKFRNVADPDIVFSSALGTNVEGLDVAYEVSQGISAITVLLSDNKRIVFEVKDELCYMTVQQMNGLQGEIDSVDFETLKTHLINDEDIHSDSEQGFSSKCKAIWFGDRGKEIAEGTGQKIISITNYDEEPIVFIRYADFSLFFLAIYIFKNMMLGSHYESSAEFTKYEWEKLLDLVEELSAFDNYQELHDYLADYGRKYGNNNYEQYITSIKSRIHNREAEAKDMTNALREWVEDALNPGDNVCVNEW